MKTCYSSDAPSTLSGSTKYECNSPPSNRKYLSPSPTPATRCRNLSDKSLSRRDLNDHSPTPQRRFDQPTPNLFPSPTPNVFSIPHRNISRSPEVLLSCGGFPLHEVDCSKPLPPRPSKYFPQSPSLKKLFHASSSKAKVMVQPAKSTPPRYANTRGGPVSNHFHASPVNGRGSKDKVESRSFRNLFKKGAGTRAGESFFDF